VTTSILLADAHQLVREALRRILEDREDLRVVAEVSDGEQAVREAQERPIDVAILETNMPRLSGIEAIRRIRKSDPNTKCIVLSGTTRRRDVEDALRAGASGYVVKTSGSDELLRAIDAVRQGRSYLSNTVTQHVFDAIAGNGTGPQSGIASLTGREREVLQLITEGDSSKEIAARLGICTKTVESHRASLMDKLGIHKVSSLVRFAIREGMVTP
jgi:DNA-binding NarL/FixJ family response regulator